MVIIWRQPLTVTQFPAYPINLFRQFLSNILMKIFTCTPNISAILEARCSCISMIQVPDLPMILGRKTSYKIFMESMTCSPYRSSSLVTYYESNSNIMVGYVFIGTSNTSKIVFLKVGHKEPIYIYTGI